MSRASNGTYTRVSNSFSNPAASTTIDPTDATALFNDIQTEMTDSLCRSGKGSMLADLSMGGFAITTATSIQFAGSSSGFTVVRPAAAASGTLTLPAATDTLVAKATTDTLTNKSISGATNTVALDALASQAAYTFVGNNSGSSARPAAVDVAALTTKASPAAGDYIMISDQAASGAWKKATVSSVSTAGSVASLNGATGAITTDLSALQNASLAVSASAGALTIALKDASGSDPSAGSPCEVNFRNATTTTGTYSTLSVTAATSLVVSSGSTLGVTSSTAFRLWVVLFNDAGTARLGVINCATFTSTTAQIYPLAEEIVASSTAEGGAGAADSAGVFYTGTAVSSKPYRILGYLEWSATGLTAGTWTTTNLLYVQSFGPGVRKPGDMVQSIFFSTTSTTTNSTNSYTDSAILANISPTSAANLVRVMADGDFQSANPNHVGQWNISRGTTSLTGDRSGLFMNTVTSSNATASWAGSFNDAPQTTSSTKYVVRFRDATNGVTMTMPGNSGNITVQEIHT